MKYIEPDHLGTPRAVIEVARNVAVWSWDAKSEAFGNSAPNENPDGDSFKLVFDMRFPGQRYDAVTGMNYNYFRDYDAGTGRYGQSDPIGFGGGLSTYAYVEGNALSFIDSFGLSKAIWISPIRDPGLYAGAISSPDRAGILTIYAHGGPNAINGPSALKRYGPRLNAKEAADLIRQNPAWNGKDPILLEACNTGKKANGFAQQLANELGVTVYAPSTFIWTNPTGVIGPMDEAADGGPDYSNPGQYNVFIPILQKP